MSIYSWFVRHGNSGERTYMVSYCELVLRDLADSENALII